MSNLVAFPWLERDLVGTERVHKVLISAPSSGLSFSPPVPEHRCITCTIQQQGTTSCTIYQPFVEHLYSINLQPYSIVLINHRSSENWRRRQLGFNYSAFHANKKTQWSKPKIELRTFFLTCSRI